MENWFFLLLPSSMDKMWCFLYHIICLSDFGVVLFSSMMSKMFENHYNQQQHAAQTPYRCGQFPVAPVQGDTVKIYCEAGPGYRFSSINGHIGMGSGSDLDPIKQWIMDASRIVKVQDEAGFPAFTLINKATVQALRDGKDENERVTLGQYHPEESLFKQRADVGNGCQCIRPVSNIHLNLNTKIGDGKHHEITKEGAKVVLSRLRGPDDGGIVPQLRLTKSLLLIKLIFLWTWRPYTKTHIT